MYNTQLTLYITINSKTTNIYLYYFRVKPNRIDELIKKS